MSRVIFHLDMDAFYAAIEQRDHPELRGKPVIVGSPPNQRGVVCASSYEARRFGVRSAMPSATAGRLCPQGNFVPPRMSHYREESRRIMEILDATGARIERMSIDEAYLEFSGDLIPDDALIPPAINLARSIKQTIFEQRQLTATIGIASNKLLAKLASDFRKPDGLTWVPDSERALFLRPLSVRTLHGVGQVTENILNQAGLRTIGDLQDHLGDLRKFVGSFGPTLKRYAVGEDDRPLDLETQSKSISSEETFDRDTADKRILRDCLLAQAKEVAAELADKGLGARTVHVKIRYSDFSTLTRQISMEYPVCDAREVFRLGCFLMARERLANRPVRLLGLGVSGFGDSMGRQLKFWQDL